MNEHLRGAAFALAATASAASNAQSSDPAELREELGQARAAMKGLQTKIDSIEARLGRYGSPPTAVPATVLMKASPPQSAAKSLPVVHVPSLEAQRANGNAKGDNKATRALPNELAEQTTVPGIGSFAVIPDGLSSSIQFLAGSGDERATISVGSSTTRGSTVAATTQWQMRGSAPLSKGNDSTSFATLDGLETGAKLELSWNIFRLPIPDDDPPAAATIMAAAVTRCEHANPPYAKGCSTHDNDFKDKFFVSDDRTRFDRAYANETLRKAIAFGLHGAVGFDRYTFFDATDLGETKTHRWSWSAGGAVTLFPVPRSSITLDASYQRSFNAADSRVACPPSAAFGPTLCVFGALAPPERTNKVLLSSELRTIIPIANTGLLKRIALAPKFEFDALSSDVAINLPIYLVPNDKGQLIGGFQVGYTTKDNAVAGVFVGTTFGIDK